VSEEALRQAAVVIPFYRGGTGQLRVVLIRRTWRGRHAGPGGRLVHLTSADPVLGDPPVFPLHPRRITPAPARPCMRTDLAAQDARRAR
jgi:hypothetical protein